MKILDKLKSDDRIARIDGNGHRVILRPGFSETSLGIPFHVIVEKNLNRMAARLKSIAPCECKSCKDRLRTPATPLEIKTQQILRSTLGQAEGMGL